MRSWQIVCVLGLVNYILLIAVQLLSDMIAPWSLALHTEVLFLIFPTLALKVTPGLVYCLLLSLLLASLRPLGPTSTLVSILAIYHLISLLRGRLLPRSQRRIGLHCAMIQLLYVTLQSLWLMPEHADVTTFWIRSLSEGFISALFVGAFSGLWFHWQDELITQMGQFKSSPIKT